MLIQYKQEHDDTNVFQTNRGLRKWVSKQQTLYNQGKLTSDRINSLEEIDFDFIPTKSVWLTQLVLLIKYKQEHGDCNVLYNNCGLEKWVTRWITYYKNKKLSSQRMHLLNSIDFQ